MLKSCGSFRCSIEVSDQKRSPSLRFGDFFLPVAFLYLYFHFAQECLGTALNDWTIIKTWIPKITGNMVWNPQPKSRKIPNNAGPIAELSTIMDVKRLLTVAM